MVRPGGKLQPASETCDKCTSAPPCNSSSVALEFQLCRAVSAALMALWGPCVPSLGLLVFTPLILQSFASTAAFQDASSPPGEFMAAAHTSGSPDAFFSSHCSSYLDAASVWFSCRLEPSARFSPKQTCDLVWCRSSVLNVHNSHKKKWKSWFQSAGLSCDLSALITLDQNCAHVLM